MAIFWKEMNIGNVARDSDGQAGILPISVCQPKLRSAPSVAPGKRLFQTLHIVYLPASMVTFNSQRYILFA
jgi:hypothetical protein